MTMNSYILTVQCNKNLTRNEQEFINHRKLTEFGNLALIENRNPLEGGSVAIALPGVQKGDMASRNFKPEVKVYSVRFSPTAQSWSAATTEGLLMYSLDSGVVFDPLNLSIEITPKTIRQHLICDDYSNALVMALKLNEANLIEEVIEKIPATEGIFKKLNANICLRQCLTSNIYVFLI